MYQKLSKANESVEESRNKKVDPAISKKTTNASSNRLIDEQSEGVSIRRDEDSQAVRYSTNIPEQTISVEDGDIVIVSPAAPPKKRALGRNIRGFRSQRYPQSTKGTSRKRESKEVTMSPRPGQYNIG